MPIREHRSTELIKKKATDNTGLMSRSGPVHLVPLEVHIIFLCQGLTHKLSHDMLPTMWLDVVLVHSAA